MSTPTVDLYFRFVDERHCIWEERQVGAPQPWTSDPILASRKFTNVFRVLDPGSQFLLQELLTGDDLTPDDILARAYLYRLSDHESLWQYARSVLGRYPRAEDLGPDLADVWVAHKEAGGQLYSGAYMIRPEPPTKGADKAATVVMMAARLLAGVAAEDFFSRTTMSGRFTALRSHPGIGDFLAMQVLTDYGYSAHGADQDENAFIIAGPGARAGATHIDPTKKPEELIRWAREVILEGLIFDTPEVQGRVPSLMDIQNTFCEFGKYMRYYNSARPAGKPYVPAHPGHQPDPVLPKHWQSQQ